MTNDKDHSIDQNLTGDFFKKILNSVHEAVIVVDSQTKIVFVNNAYCRLFDVAPTQIIGRLLADIEPNANMLQVLRERKPISGCLVKVDSADKFVISNVEPLFQGGKLWGAVSVIRDITEVIELTNILRHITNIDHKASYLDDIIQFSADNILGRSISLQRVLLLAGKIAKKDVNILITGETGTGKELLARAIHDNSLQAASPFVTVNSAAIPDSLFESELFGYEPGAFTGASSRGKLGKFQLANNGTLFLDEVGELTQVMQAKLLRVLETREIDKIGGNNPIKVSVRIIAATNRDLSPEALNNNFRSDLYYRLSTIVIELPPLRFRNDDVILLANHFLSKLGDETGKKYKLSLEASKHLLGYNWPGNIRELKNVITRAALVSDDGFLDLNHILSNKGVKNKQENVSSKLQNLSTDLDYKSFIMFQEKAIIEKALIISNGNKTMAADLINMNRKTFYNKLKRYKIS